jgi:hypothetical protein
MLNKDLTANENTISQYISYLQDSLQPINSWLVERFCTKFSLSFMYWQTWLAQLKWAEMKPVLSLHKQIALWMVPDKKNVLSPMLYNSALEYAP